MRPDAKSWHEGHRAGLRGTGLAARRYPVGTTESWSWSSGYIEGSAARLKKHQPALDETSEH